MKPEKKTFQQMLNSSFLDADQDKPSKGEVFMAHWREQTRQNKQYRGPKLTP